MSDQQATGTRRPSHDLLMAAQEALGQARDAEREAGNLPMSRFINELVLTVFKLALDDEIDAVLDRAFATADATERLRDELRQDSR